MLLILLLLSNKRCGHGQGVEATHNSHQHTQTQEKETINHQTSDD
jgi:hypothetical protein